jgi:Na+/melibiose symporter-like transporter
LLAFVFAFIAVSRYNLSREDIAEVQRQLKEKADAAEATAAAEAAVTLDNGGV